MAARSSPSYRERNGMNTFYLRKVRNLFTNEFATPSIYRHNIRAWVRMIRILGPAWRGLPQ